MGEVTSLSCVFSRSLPSCLYMIHIKQEITWYIQTNFQYNNLLFNLDNQANTPETASLMKDVQADSSQLEKITKIAVSIHYFYLLLYIQSVHTTLCSYCTQHSKMAKQAVMWNGTSFPWTARYRTIRFRTTKFWTTRYQTTWSVFNGISSQQTNTRNPLSGSSMH